MDVISDKAEKLKEMIESLFSLAKASGGNIQIHPEPVELNMLIEQILRIFWTRIDASGLHFVKLLTEEDTHLMTDNLHMYRICQNLIENALKYSAPDTRVFVKTYFAQESMQRKLYLEITNTAGYFMDFDKEDIIERFARGDKARTDGGNRLDLPLSALMRARWAAPSISVSTAISSKRFSVFRQRTRDKYELRRKLKEYGIYLITARRGRTKFRIGSLAYLGLCPYSHLSLQLIKGITVLTESDR